MGDLHILGKWITTSYSVITCRVMWYLCWEGWGKGVRKEGDEVREVRNERNWKARILLVSYCLFRLWSLVLLPIPLYQFYIISLYGRYSFFAVRFISLGFWMWSPFLFLSDPILLVFLLSFPHAIFIPYFPFSFVSFSLSIIRMWSSLFIPLIIC